MSGAPGVASGAGRVLVAGIGNVFLGDDGFGVEVVRRLAERTLPPGVELADTGVRGVHLAYQLLEGYRAAVLVDVVRRDGPPGSLYLIDAGRPRPAGAEGALLDGHRMSPDAVLALLDTLSAGLGSTRPERLLVVGCEPAELEEGIGLSDAVGAAVEPAAEMVLAVAAEEARAAPEPGGRTV